MLDDKDLAAAADTYWRLCPGLLLPPGVVLRHIYGVDYLFIIGGYSHIGFSRCFHTGTTKQGVWFGDTVCALLVFCEIVYVPPEHVDYTRWEKFDIISECYGCGSGLSVMKGFLP